MKRSKLILIFIIGILLLSGCDSKKSNVVSDGKKVNTSGMSHKKCSRKATAASGIDVSLHYDLYYKGDRLNILHSIEKVTSSSSESLDEYEKAYNNIYRNYDGLKYYDAKVIRGDTTVTSDLTINYEKIDINKLLEIEGSEDNIIDNGHASVSKWLSLSKKFGTKCEDVQ